MILTIDTTEFGKVKFALGHRNNKIQKSFLVKPQESEKILEFLDEFLKKSKITPPIPSPLPRLYRRGSREGLGRGKIQKMVVYKGQGSFTGLRIAAAIAQALSLVWDAPASIRKIQ